jgi:hypothetical protein
MAVAVEMNFRGATMEQYDQILQKMGLTPNGATPPGALFHWVAQADDGIRVVDVWDSQEQYDQFAQEKIGPYSAEVGIIEPPEMRVYEVHNYLGRDF